MTGQIWQPVVLPPVNLTQTVFAFLGEVFFFYKVIDCVSNYHKHIKRLQNLVYMILDKYEKTF